MYQNQNLVELGAKNILTQPVGTSDISNPPIWLYLFYNQKAELGLKVLNSCARSQHQVGTGFPNSTRIRQKLP